MMNEELLRQQIIAQQQRQQAGEMNQMAANMPMPNPAMAPQGQGFLGRLGDMGRRAGIGMQNVMGKLGQGMFPVDPTVAATMSPDQIKAMRNQAMMQMGLGMMGAAGQGKGFGESLAQGYFGSQKNMLGRQQMSYQLGAQQREENRQRERDVESDRRFGVEAGFTERGLGMQDKRFGAERDDEQWMREYRDRSLKTQASLQAAGLGMEAKRLELGWAQLEQSGQLGLLRIAAQNQKAGKLTEGEQRTVSYASRMRNAEKALADAGYAPQGVGGVYNTAMSKVPGGDLFTSQNYQKYEASAREWIAGVLRYDSGAAVPETEFQRYFKTWFPQPGNGPEVIAQKEQMRELARQSLEAALPPQGQEKIEQIAPGMGGPLGAPGRAGGATGSWAPTPEGMAAYEKYAPR